MKKSFDVFPTRIIKFENCISDQQKKDALEFFHNYENKNSHGLLTNDSLSLHDNQSNILSLLKRNFDSWKTFNLDQFLFTYCEETGFNHCKLTNSWINFQKSNSSLIFHSHPLSHISGALYIKKEKNSPNLQFINPNPFIKYTSTDHSHFPTWKFITIDTLEKDLILFPSWLEHGFEASNQNESERCVLSFNTM